MRGSHFRVAPARRTAIFLAACFLAALAAGARAEAEPAIEYTVSVAEPAAHLVHVTIALPPGAAERELQLPVWNALYQVRDFSQYVDWVRAKGPAGGALAVRLLNKSLWRIEGAQQGAEVQYEILADDGGPYGAQLNAHHGFFNLAELLMYPVDERAAEMRVRFEDVPAGWRIATVLPLSGDTVTAENYDRLVDSPVEMSAFDEADFDEGGGHYRIVVDADHSDYDMKKLVPMARRIVAAETEWMNDRPFSTYMFLYHFPKGPGGGGMEHAYCTAIDVSAEELKQNALALPDVTAHEFFHLWNVKRIRPKSLVPVDYTKENYTRALWFSEGVTNTVEDYTMLHTGMLDNSSYLQRLAREIAQLEDRPAHLTQSAEQSSLDAWLEKYTTYWSPRRSISYYNKGGLLGVLLDLEIRRASDDRASLRDLFQWMNAHYAKKNVPFADSEGVEAAAEAVSHAKLDGFFQKYVEGTEEIPWNDFLQSVGLQLVRTTHTAPDAGFQVSRAFGGVLLVTEVNGEAQQAGLQEGDTLLEINGKPAAGEFQTLLADMRPGDALRVKVQSDRGERTLQWKIGRRDEVAFSLQDVQNITSTQKAGRAAWLSGEDSPSSGAHN